MEAVAGFWTLWVVVAGGQRVTEEQFAHSSGSQVLLYLNISQHLGYFSSTYPTQHRNAQFEEPTLLLVKSPISTINTFDVFTSKPKMGSAAPPYLLDPPNPVASSGLTHDVLCLCLCLCLCHHVF